MVINDTTNLYGEVGAAIPVVTPHAISVSLPTWRDNVDYEEANPRVVSVMKNGYPRFFIHLSIRKLMHICLHKFGTIGENCILFPSKKAAERCRAFMLDQSTKTTHKIAAPLNIRLVQLVLYPDEQSNADKPGRINIASSVELHIVLFQEDAFPLAKEFWQHTGMGVSSRLAEHCLALLSSEPTPTLSPTIPRFVKTSNRHYSQPIVSNAGGTNPVAKSPSPPAAADSIEGEHSVYVEERYGRNLPLSSAASAKQALRRRIAGVLVKDDSTTYSRAGEDDAELGPSSRGVKDLTENDVFIFSTGMTAIWNAHNVALQIRPPAKSVCFGFPYIDTLKILQKWGPGCHHLGHGLDSSIDELEKILKEGSKSSSEPPIVALFTEFPSNPLLRSADLPRIRKLADQYDFLVVVDDSIGNFANVDVLPYSDIVVSSLTKIFSGDANVMGGSLVLNPRGRHYAALKKHLMTNYEDTYFDEDAIFLERNSRDFRRRAQVIDRNTEELCDYLFSRSIAGGNCSGVIKNVYYPKYITPQHYLQCRNQTSGGSGGLFSLTFTSYEASQVFYDALECYKGPSLGTNFTLASPFVILAHYTELDWAEGWGVERGLVRVSVGMEEGKDLLDRFKMALEQTEEAVVRP